MSPYFSIASVNFLDIVMALNLQSFKENIFMSDSCRGCLVKLVQFHLPSGNIDVGIVSDTSQSSLFPAGCIMMCECLKALLNEWKCMDRGKVVWTMMHLHSGLMGLKVF